MCLYTVYWSHSLTIPLQLYTDGQSLVFAKSGKASSTFWDLEENLEPHEYTSGSVVWELRKNVTVSRINCGYYVQIFSIEDMYKAVEPTSIISKKYHKDYLS